MRERLRQDLESYNTIAKQDIESTPEEVKDLLPVLTWHLEQAANRQETNIRTQAEIYQIQTEKQKIMKRLEKELSDLYDIDATMSPRYHDRLTSYNAENKSFSYENDLGEKGIATFGEIMTDLNWGITYHLDKDSTPKKLMKRYLVTRAKHELMDLLNQQIIKNEIEGRVATDGVKRAYKAIEEDGVKGELENKSGFIAENIVKGFLGKLSIDKDLPFEVRDADVYQDVVQKIDFIIHRKDHTRGVEVKTHDKERLDVGIQFTINEDAAQHKAKQLEKSRHHLRQSRDRIQSLALVVFPVTAAKWLKDKWTHEGRPAGGPDQYLSEEMAQKLFKKIFEGILSKEEIESFLKEKEESISISV